VRRLGAPHRTVDDHVVVARPGDGTVLVLGGAAATVWTLIDDARSYEWIVDRLRELQPAHPDAALRQALDDALRLLADEGLLAS